MYNCQLLAKVGDTVEPGTKIAIISKSADDVAHVAPSEQPSSKPSVKKEKTEEEKPKAEAAPQEKPKTPSPPPSKAPTSPPTTKTSPSEPQLPPKERERRVNITLLLVTLVVSFELYKDFVFNSKMILLF